MSMKRDMTVGDAEEKLRVLREFLSVIAHDNIKHLMLQSADNPFYGYWSESSSRDFKDLASFDNKKVMKLRIQGYLPAYVEDCKLDEKMSPMQAAEKAKDHLKCKTFIHAIESWLRGELFLAVGKLEVKDPEWWEFEVKAFRDIETGELL